MHEIEVKILDVNVKGLEKKLLDLGAKKVFDGELFTVYFDIGKKRTLRVRKKGPKVFITYKEQVSQELAKICDELETTIGDFDTVRTIFSRLFDEQEEDRRWRTSYSYKDALIEIDQYPNIPAFAEVEAPNMTRLKQVLRDLGYSLKDTKPWTGGQVQKYYAKKKE